MTIKYSCNRCEKISDKEIMYEIIVRNPKGKTLHGYDERMDLCSECMDDLSYFLKQQQAK